MKEQADKAKVLKEEFIQYLATVIPSWQMPASKFFSEINASIKRHFKEKENKQISSILELNDIEELESVLHRMSSAQKYVYAKRKQTKNEEGLQRYISFLKQRKSSEKISNRHFISTDEEIQKATEGFVSEVEFFRSKRNRTIRDKCAERDHYTCQVCGFNFEKVYGERGKGFIEIHHTKPLSSYDGEHEIKLEHLIALCSNCHSMIHYGGSFLKISELKRLLKLIIFMWFSMNIFQ